jgi:hypothetical protein
MKKACKFIGVAKIADKNERNSRRNARKGHPIGGGDVPPTKKGRAKIKFIQMELWLQNEQDRRNDEEEVHGEDS